jgi:hypothetical protein
MTFYLQPERQKDIKMKSYINIKKEMSKVKEAKQKTVLSTSGNDYFLN